MQILIRNNTFSLLSQKALLWEDQHTLVLSDLHIGKVSHFRREGLAVPVQAFLENFARLDFILAHHTIHRIIFAGDLFHSHINQEWEVFREWRRKHAAIQMDIVIGNHDRFAKPYYQEAVLQIHDGDLQTGPFVFSHYPKEQIPDEVFVFAGHIHPVVMVRGIARQQLKFSCFHISPQQCILPSFGYFTGGHIIVPRKGDTVIAVVGDTLMDVSGLV